MSLSTHPLPRLPLATAPMSLFPTMGSLHEVLDFADAQLPITNKNELLTLLMIYHNTFLKVITHG